MIAARAEELEEASTEPRESSDPGHGTYQDESVATRALTLSMSPQNSASTLWSSPSVRRCRKSRINLEYDGPWLAIHPPQGGRRRFRGAGYRGGTRVSHTDVRHDKQHERG
jgi:hypothetical protein